MMVGNDFLFRAVSEIDNDYATLRVLSCSVVLKDLGGDIWKVEYLFWSLIEQWKPT